MEEQEATKAHPKSRRIKLIVEYDGSNFAGLQTQAQSRPHPSVSSQEQSSPEGERGRLNVKPIRTIQQVLEAALAQIPGTTASAVACGRTDAGVHALAMPFHYDTQDAIPEEKIPYALNSFLPSDIRVLHAEEVEADFHARKSCHWRHYRYRVLQRRIPPALDRQRVWWIPQSLNPIPMRHALEYLVGMHDFKAFAVKEERSTVRQVYRAHLEVRASESWREVWLEFVGSGFLRGQVRSMVGTLVEVGLGKRDSGNILGLLQAGTRSDAGPTAPPQGLYFVQAGYEPYKESGA